MICPEETELARMDRVDNQVRDKVLVARVVKPLAPGAGEDDAVVVEPARERAAAVAADRDRVAVKAVDAVRNANPNRFIIKEGGTTSCQDLTEADPWAPDP
jgi:hypothetical protein